jgi:hypothetical protein
MRIIARDVNMLALSEIDMYTSFIWTDRYSDSGDFELRVPYTEQNEKLFNTAKYLTIDKSNRVMVIEKRQSKTQVDKSDEFIISGKSGETLLNRRIIMGSMTFGTSPHDEQTNENSSKNYAINDCLIWYGAMCVAIKSIQSGDKFILYDETKQNLYNANIRRAKSDEEATLTEPIETIVAALLNANVINPTDPTRRFTNPGWRYIPSTDNRIKEIKMAASFSNTNLYDALSSLLVGAGLGCKVTYNDETETLDFSLYIGTDHSVSQSKNPIVSFKNVLDNLVSTDFITNDADYKTCAYVVGAIDDRKTRTVYVADEYGRVEQVEVPNPNYCTIWAQQVSLSGTGMSYQRREVVINADDIDRYQTVSSPTGSSSTDVAISEVDYRSMLKTRGKSELMKLYSTYDLEAEIISDMFYKYGEDYSLGDTISIEDRFGHTINASITEMIYSVDSNGYKSYPTIETIGAVDGMDQLISIFINNPIHIDANKVMIIPDIRNELTELGSQTYIAYYVKAIIDYLLDDHLIFATGGETGYRIVVPSWDDMDTVVLGGNIAEIYENPGRFPDVNTRALQFVKFMKENQIRINAEDIVVPPLDDLASYVQ